MDPSWQSVSKITLDLPRTLAECKSPIPELKLLLAISISLKPCPTTCPNQRSLYEVCTFVELNERQRQLWVTNLQNCESCSSPLSFGRRRVHWLCVVKQLRYYFSNWPVKGVILWRVAVIGSFRCWCTPPGVREGSFAHQTVQATSTPVAPHIAVLKASRHFCRAQGASYQYSTARVSTILTGPVPHDYTRLYMLDLGRISRFFCCWIAMMPSLSNCTLTGSA